MIYNECGIIISETAIIGRTKLLLPTDYFIESELELSYDQEKNVKQLKEIIKSCDKESLKKIKSNDRKFKYVSDKIRNVLSEISGWSATGGLLGALISSGLWMTGKKKGFKIVGITTAFLYASFMILEKIVRVSDNNKDKNKEQLIKLANGAIDKLKKISSDSKIPEEIRNDAKEKCEKISKLTDNIYSDSNVSKNNHLIADVKVNGHEIELRDIRPEKYQENKSYYDNFLKKVNSSCQKIINDIRKQMIEEWPNEDYGLIGQDKNSEWEFNWLYEYEDGTLVLYGYIWNDNILKDNAVPLEIEYTKSGKMEYEYGAIG